MNATATATAMATGTATATTTGTMLLPRHKASTHPTRHLNNNEPTTNWLETKLLNSVKNNGDGSVTMATITITNINNLMIVALNPKP